MKGTSGHKSLPVVSVGMGIPKASTARASNWGPQCLNKAPFVYSPPRRQSMYKKQPDNCNLLPSKYHKIIKQLFPSIPVLRCLQPLSETSLSTEFYKLAFPRTCWPAH